MLGLVVKNTGNSYWVQAEGDALVECKIKGNFRIKGIRSTNPIAIGDRVLYDVQPDGVAWIYEIV